MAARVWDIEISAAVNAKINSKHGISADDVYEACIGHPIRATVVVHHLPDQPVGTAGSARSYGSAAAGS